MPLTLLDDRYQVAGVFVWLLGLNGEEFIFTGLSDSVIIVKDLSKCLSNVLEFLSVHSSF